VQSTRFLGKNKISKMFTSATKNEKISDHIIRQIRNAILCGDFKAGDRLGSEKELMEDFGVSKASVREALRVLEVMGLIEIRKGISGGIFVAEVDMQTTLNSITNFLHFKTVSIKDITMVRYLLEPSLGLFLASIVTKKDIKQLEKMIARPTIDPKDEVSREISFHRYLARLSQNPLLILIMVLPTQNKITSGSKLARY